MELQDKVVRMVDATVAEAILQAIRTGAAEVAVPPKMAG